VDAAATLAIAILAGGTVPVAMRLGASMLALQASIGALNDVVDAPRDAGRKPGKPIPAGLVSRQQGAVVALAAAVVGLALAAPSGLATLVVAAVILLIGGIYDLRLKGTPWSWLPFATGIPLLPVFAWLGTGAPLPAAFVVIVPAAALAGAGLAIGNALVDVERDRAAGVTSIAAHLGPAVAWRLMTVLFVSVVALAVVTALVARAPWQGAVGSVGAAAVVLAGCVSSRAPGPARRERGWRLQVIGVALLAAVWLGSTVVARGGG
jgi:4-hydroxybenzoate polyprenyltransferase